MTADGWEWDPPPRLVNRVEPAGLNRGSFTERVLSRQSCSLKPSCDAEKPRRS
jgi:hypothetical protein